MLAVLAFVAFLLAFIFQVAGGPHEAWLQPPALLYLGLAFLAIYQMYPGYPWRHG